jgi:hypothetical protein
MHGGGEPRGSEGRYPELTFAEINGLVNDAAREMVALDPSDLRTVHLKDIIAELMYAAYKRHPPCMTNTATKRVSTLLSGNWCRMTCS